MRILCLQTTNVNFAHRSFSECLGRVHDVVYYGDGFTENYNPNISIHEILEQHGKFDLILGNVKGYFIRDLFEIKNIPKVVIVADYFGWRKGKVDWWLETSKYDLAFALNDHWTVTELKRSKLVPKVFFIPPGADEKLFYKADVPKTIDVMAVYSHARNFYPLRAHIKEVVQNMKDLNTMTSRRVPPEKYADYVRQSKIFIHSGDRVGSVFFKYFEVMACGTLFLTDWASDMHTCGVLGGRHVATFRGPQDLESTIRYYLEHEAEREKIAETGRQYALKNFTDRKITAYFTKIVQRELF